MKVSKLTKMLSKVDLTVDLDTHNQFQLLKTYFNAKWLASNINKKADVKVYITKHGFHIRVKGVKTNIHHRCGLGDDKERIYLSEIRGGVDYADDVLFNIKYLKRGDGKVLYKSCEEEYNVMSLPFWNIYIKRKRR